MGNNNQSPGYTIEPFSRVRELVIDVMLPARKKHNIHILFEADITDVRNYLRKQKAETGKSISLTAYLIKCSADATMTNKRLSARRISARRLVVCDDMHVSCMVEAEIDGQSQPLGLIVRQANRKGVAEINGELTGFTEEKKQEQIGRSRLYSKLPRFIRSRFYRYFTNNPKLIVNHGYNVLVTSVGMFGAGGGHVIPYTDASLCIGVGGITRKPGIVEERIEPREFLAITVTYDHNITDGAPAARFAQELKELVECGHGLFDN
ncbi:MAG: 2-oxo acid dehydrogenase subunit E2 [Chloroflexota bacterium]|nr:MAG: 2-oxo acid dehydrogenase subunit E2 [Chloroflexota bacterium]